MWIVAMDYADGFTDGVSRNTFAYPTKIYDPAANFSEVKYRFDDGSNVEAKSPAPAGNTIGKQTKREFDNIGRLIKDKIVNTGAYVRYEYPANMIQSKSFSTIVDTNNSNTADTADEVYSESWSDGAGRTLRSRMEHPGSTGGWSGSLAEYNILGQVKRASVATEINSNYEPAGDDYPRGWLWNEIEYDWKGRTTSLINTDGTEKSMSYEGCGCAGGLVVTEKGELLPEGRRTQKSYSDILGRVYKTEVLNWDNSVYSTVKSTFNGRDQAVEVKQYNGSDSSTIFQTTLATFDGHGRLKTRHLPEQQNPDGSAAFTTYNYNVDDTTSSVTDARGAATNLVYNDPRGLVTNINYTVPANSNIPVTPSVSLSYDNLGNRTAMTDGIGTVSYEHNQLSQLTAETRDFSDFTTGVPADGFRLEYLYSLSGQLKSYKDPYNRQFDFSFDKVGRALAVNGTAYAGVSNYTSNQQYRAFGALKQISYGNQTTATMSYNSRLQPSSYRLNDANQILFGKDYYYTTDNNNDNDGLLKKSVHFDNTMSANEQAKRNQVNTYDAVGRIKTSQTGEAVTPFGANIKNGPFQQTYSYDSFGNMTGKNDRDFADIVGCTGCPRTLTFSETSVNNRAQSSTYTASNFNQYTYINNYQYDQDGRLVNRDGDLATFDAGGKMVFRDAPQTSADASYAFDGDGDLTKWIQTDPGLPSYYYLRSSVFAANVLELNVDGSMAKEFVFSQNGKQLAFLKDNAVIWLHYEPSGKESYEIKQDRTANSKVTYDPSGATATSNGYNGGGTCPPQSCYNSANGAVSGLVNRGFDGLEQLTQWRNAQWLQTNQFKLIEMGYEKIWRRIDGITNAPPPPGYVPPDERDGVIIGSEEFATADRFEFFLLPIINLDLDPNSDCAKFVAIVTQIASESANEDDFMKAMVKRFIGDLKADSESDFLKSANVGDREFGASGFLEKFKDKSNQVRHFTGGLWAGYLYGSAVGYLGMNTNETSTFTDGKGVIRSAAGLLPSLFPSGTDAADVALNSISTSLGADLEYVPKHREEVGDRGGVERNSREARL